jgi:hypothetical protein
VFLWLVLVALFVLYWAPTYLAWELDCEHLKHIALVNLLLGWTVIGWVVAGVMAWRDRPIPPNLYANLRRSIGDVFTPTEE